MHDLMIILKSTFLVCIVWFTELFITSVTALSFIPLNVREFFDEIKTPLSVVVSFAILILTIIKIIKINKK